MVQVGDQICLLPEQLRRSTLITYLHTYLHQEKYLDTDYCTLHVFSYRPTVSFCKCVCETYVIITYYVIVTGVVIICAVN